MKQEQNKPTGLDDLSLDGKKLSIKQMIVIRGGADDGSHPGRWT